MMNYAKCIVLAVLALTLSACRSSGNGKQASGMDCDNISSEFLQDDKMSEGLRRFLKTCREEWMRRGYPGDEQPLEEYPLTHWESRAEYKIVYASNQFVSYWAYEWSKEYSYRGYSKLYVGTLLTSTGRRLKLKDLYDNPKEEAELKKAWEAAVARGNFWYESAKYNPGLRLDTLDKPFMTGNFFVMGNDIHFIYHQGEVAGNSHGAVEVIVPNWRHGVLAEEGAQGY